MEKVEELIEKAGHLAFTLIRHPDPKVSNTANELESIIDSIETHVKGGETNGEDRP